VADFTQGPPTAGTLVRPGVRVPVVSVRLPIARRLARSRPRLRVRVAPIAERRVAQNVVAELPGTGTGRVVMAGGHMDSIQRGMGINDNGSGVAALIEMGRRIAAQPRGRATVRLAFWAAHENGMFGSLVYVRGLPRAERRRIGAYLNIDMVGSRNGVPEIYATNRRIRRAIARHLRGAGRTSSDSGSDHAPFMQARIPIGGIYTGSLEPKDRRQRRRWGGRAGIERDACYHQPCDDLDNINLPMLSLTATAAADALRDLGR
jgi:aminopeptidase S